MEGGREVATAGIRCRRYDMFGLVYYGILTVYIVRVSVLGNGTLNYRVTACQGSLTLRRPRLAQRVLWSLGAPTHRASAFGYAVPSLDLHPSAARPAYPSRPCRSTRRTSPHGRRGSNPLHPLRPFSRDPAPASRIIPKARQARLTHRLPTRSGGSPQPPRNKRRHFLMRQIPDQTSAPRSSPGISTGLRDYRPHDGYPADLPGQPRDVVPW